jgi:hypothetical protein
MDAVRDWISVLLPLVQPPPVETLVDWQSDLRSSIARNLAGRLMDEVLIAASAGRPAVEQVLASTIQTRVASVLEDDQMKDDGRSTQNSGDRELNRSGLIGGCFV